LVKVVLYQDFAEKSFSIGWFRAKAERREEGAVEYWLPESGTIEDIEYEHWFSGGLIFHPGAGQPDTSMSVELTGSSSPHWTVHT
jgi:hypothetical protein